MSDPFLDRLATKAPFAVMGRLLLDEFLDGSELDELFETHAQRQYSRRVLFSQITQLAADVVFRSYPSVHAAYIDRQGDFDVTLTAVYDKLNHTELGLSEQLVRHSAVKAQALLDDMDIRYDDWLPGYRLRIVDGNLLGATERRLDVFDGAWAKGLPGRVLAVWDQRSRLITHAFLERDGHASERTLYGRLEPIIEAGDLWLADRHFCTKALLRSIDDQQAFFVIRQHGTYVGHTRKEPEFVGKCSTGSVYSQEWYPTDPGDREPKVTYRRITVKLDAPTRDGDTEIHLITNLPSDPANAEQPAIDAVRVVELYAKRWTIENGFRDLAAVFEAEPKTLAHPEAALFLFCVGLLGLNVARVLESVLEEQLEEVARNLSLYFIMLEVCSYAKAIDLVDQMEWNLIRTDRRKFIGFLRRLAKGIDAKKYPKRRHRRKPGPQRSTRKKERTHKNGSHRSTARLLDEAKRKKAEEAKQKKTEERRPRKAEDSSEKPIQASTNKNA